MAMSLAEWRASQVEDVVLPSGLPAKLRKITVLDLAARGQLPPPLLEIAVQGGKKNMSVEEFVELSGSLDDVVLAIMVSPRVVRGEGTEDALGLDEMPFADKQFVAYRFGEESRSLQKFRTEPGQPDSPVEDGEGV